jgi:hypothetical protein
MNVVLGTNLPFIVLETNVLLQNITHTHTHTQRHTHTIHVKKIIN